MCSVTFYPSFRGSRFPGARSVWNFPADPAATSAGFFRIIQLDLGSDQLVL